MQTLEELKIKEAKLLKKLQEKRLSLGEADGPNVSRFPTGRFELEQEIELYEQLLQRVKQQIKSIS
jgi:hypothetical protein